MRLKGACALITGGAKRVGKAIALELASAGANIAITYRSSEKEASQTVFQLKKAGVKAHAFYAESSSGESVRDCVRQIKSKFGGIDILINSAANFIKIPFEQLTEQDFDDSIQVNLKGPYLFSVEIGKIMLKQKRGKIVNISDWAGLRPYKNYIPYCVSKGGLITLTKALAKSLAPHVQVNAILPGAVLLPEDFNRNDKKKIMKETPLQRIGSPRDIAKTVHFLIEGSDFITGALIPVDGGRLIA